MQQLRDVPGGHQAARDDFVLLTGKTEAAFREAVWNGRSRMVFAPAGRQERPSGKEDVAELLRPPRVRRVPQVRQGLRYNGGREPYAKGSGYPLILGNDRFSGSDLEKVRMVCESLFIEHASTGATMTRTFRPYIQQIT